MRNVLIFNQQKVNSDDGSAPWSTKQLRVSVKKAEAQYCPFRSPRHLEGPEGHSVDFDSRSPQTEPLCGIKVPPFALTIAAYSRPTNSCSWVGTI